MFDFSPPLIDWMTIAPLIAVALTGLIALMVEVMMPKRTNGGIIGVSLVGLAVAGGLLINNLSMPNSETFSGMALRDHFGTLLQLLLVVTCGLSILFSEGYLREKRIPFGEFYPLLLWSTMGAMIMCMTRNLLMLFLGVEVLSISLYVLAGMSRSEERSEESAMKYFLLGAFASAFLLFGISFVYGATGTLQLASISEAWTSGGISSQALLLFGFGLIMVGLSFKSGFVPFHQWTPDVYQGAPTNVTAFMAVGSKVAAIAAVWRVFEGFQIMSDYWIPIMSWVAILTMSVGNLIALLQKDVKRILGYSSIAHAGYILVAILAHYKNPQAVGFNTVFYYLLSYALMTLGSFAVISLTAHSGREGTMLSDLNGMWKRAPFAAASLIVFMASLVGIPPTSGFVGKFLIFSDALQAGLTPLAMVLAVNSIISVYYYVGIAHATVVAEEKRPGKSGRPTFGLNSTCLLCTVGVFGAAIFYSPLMNFLQGR
ncbi:MAG: NADH-quinone oxidoreductase subunit N [Armatimonadetes bacterium]|nr:NADH-quinone oxidoreductase subunit N [Armatimonadota bacterium]